MLERFTNGIDSVIDILYQQCQTILLLSFALAEKMASNVILNTVLFAWRDSGY